MFQPRVSAAQRIPGLAPYQPPWSGIQGLLAERAATNPDVVYLIAYDDAGNRTEYRMGAFVARVRQFASYLRALGLRRGDRMATLLHNHQEAVFLMYAAWWLGAAVVPLNTEETADRMRFILQNARVALVFTLPEHVPKIQSFRGGLGHLRSVVVVGTADDSGLPDVAAGVAAEYPAAEPEGGLADEALIVYTSGTTGNPKGVVLSQYNLLADADAIAGWFQIVPGERWMCVLPVHHVNGIVVTLVSPLYAGAGVVLNRRFSPRTFWQRAADEGVSVCSLVPTLLEFLLESAPEQEEPAGQRMRGVICGAGPLLPETVTRFEARFGMPVWHGYGLSETTAYACMTPTDLSAAERQRWYTAHGFPTIGTAMAHQELSIRGTQGQELPAGERGEICLRGSTVMQGYYERPDANADAFAYEGWFRSGDEGFWLTGPGGRPFYFITGRIKELIIRGGVNLSPLEIDAALSEHPAVRFAMAVPFENRYYGEEVAAYVVLREDQERSESLAEAIRSHAAERLPYSMQPKVVLFGTEVPYTTTGKPKRLELKRLLAERLLPYREIQFREGGRHDR